MSRKIYEILNFLESNPGATTESLCENLQSLGYSAEPKKIMSELKRLGNNMYRREPQPPKIFLNEEGLRLLDDLRNKFS